VALCNHFKQPVDKQIFFPGFDQTIKIFTDVIWWVGKDQIDTFGGDLFKFGKRITVNNGLSLLPNRVGSHPVLMVTPFVTPIKKALPHAEERLLYQASN
jgi:hypothetical protein